MNDGGRALEVIMVKSKDATATREIVGRNPGWRPFSFFSAHCILLSIKLK